MNRLKALLSLALLALPLEAATANDTMANFAAGGLTFSRTDAVGMVSEDLFLSMDEVRVNYRFRNRTDRDVSGTVAFPMPDIEDHYFSDADYPDGPPENPMRFSVTVNGKSIPFSLEKKAMVGEENVTAALRELNVPLEPYAPEVDEALRRLAPPALKRLRDAGAVEVLDNAGGSGPDTELIPRWVLRATYHWQQTFPAGQDVLIGHRYKPSVGGAVVDLDSLARSGEGIASYAEGACADRDFVRGARRWAERQRKAPVAPLARYIDYVLVTGGNWAGPIGSFKLTVDKKHPDNLVSFCGEGVKKVGPTQFEMTKTDFVPRQNIKVLILDAGKS
ncbi:DUF4424 domain-containing protein [Microvirga sp. GCM10011540]|uniref:DUF4424 domain-containing protein n=1 Tax=Microvirga sp. GCM10011540 TaxID=3317338 RepID=UPI00360EF5DB